MGCIGPDLRASSSLGTTISTQPDKSAISMKQIIGFVRLGNVTMLSAAK
jgi:hypothetical protein